MGAGSARGRMPRGPGAVMRPELTPFLASADFCNWYWLKEELVLFCRENSLSTVGSKGELTARIARYLDTGEKGQPAPAEVPAARRSPDTPLTAETVIPAGYRNTETVRAWFCSVLGEGFRFNVPFMTWMKENAGRKTFGEAAAAWTEIRERLKTDKPPIGEQFEYNRYVRDFFADNPNRSRGEAIQCWKGKKSRPGHNRYERCDLDVLKRG